MGNVQALKFAAAHNKALEVRKGKRGKVRPEDRFDFNGVGGQHDWSLLHFAVFHTNLPIIALLLGCGENVDLEALDSQGRRAIDLCPYSSPIFKTIRGQLRRVALANCRRQMEERIEDDEPSLHGPPVDAAANVPHSILSSRECIVAPPRRRTIEVMQQLFHLKQLPADQPQQDVPPAPAPFP